MKIDKIRESYQPTNMFDASNITAYTDYVKQCADEDSDVKVLCPPLLNGSISLPEDLLITNEDNGRAYGICGPLSIPRNLGIYDLPLFRDLGESYVIPQIDNLFSVAGVNYAIVEEAVTFEDRPMGHRKKRMQLVLEQITSVDLTQLPNADDVVAFVKSDLKEKLDATISEETHPEFYSYVDTITINDICININDNNHMNEAGFRPRIRLFKSFVLGLKRGYHVNVEDVNEYIILHRGYGKIKMNEAVENVARAGKFAEFNLPPKPSTITIKTLEEANA